MKRWKWNDADATFRVNKAATLTEPLGKGQLIHRVVRSRRRLAKDEEETGKGTHERHKCSFCLPPKIVPSHTLGGFDSGVANWSLDTLLSVGCQGHYDGGRASDHEIELFR